MERDITLPVTLIFIIREQLAWCGAFWINTSDINNCQPCGRFFVDVFIVKELVYDIILMADGELHVDKLLLAKSTIGQNDVTIYY